MSERFNVYSLSTGSSYFTSFSESVKHRLGLVFKTEDWGFGYDPGVVRSTGP